MFHSDVVKVRVPATSSDLGPGLDALALALDAHDVVSARVTKAGVVLQAGGRMSHPDPGTSPVIKAMDVAFARLGRRPPGLHVHHHRDIPAAIGMGSSAAAVVAGICVARALVPGGDDLLGDQEVLTLAATVTGQPNGVAACLLGGLALAWTQAGRVAMATRLEPHPQLRATIFEPGSADATVRRPLAARVPLHSAFANASRSGLLVAALTQAPELLLPATEDLLRQQHHAEVLPASTALVTRLRSAGLAAVISGTGPGVLALTRGRMRDLPPIPGWLARPLDMDVTGAVTTRAQGSQPH
jgi:homoserine kinase